MAGLFSGKTTNEDRDVIGSCGQAVFFRVDEREDRRNQPGQGELRPVEVSH